jgi:uncharacterized protein YbjT (DUF2867 family)
LTAQITGATGYIGFQTLTLALRRGYRVRAVVRREGNIVELTQKSALLARGQSDGTLEFVVVNDFLDQNSLQQALKNVTTVIHLASPLAIEVSEEGGVLRDIKADVKSTRVMITRRTLSNRP